MWVGSISLISSISSVSSVSSVDLGRFAHSDTNFDLLSSGMIGPQVLFDSPNVSQSPAEFRINQTGFKSFNQVKECYSKIADIDTKNKRIKELATNREEFVQRVVNNRWYQAAVVIGGLALTALGVGAIYYVATATHAFVIANSRDIMFFIGLSMMGGVTIAIPLIIAAIPVALVCLGIAGAGYGLYMTMFPTHFLSGWGPERPEEEISKRNAIAAELEKILYKDLDLEALAAQCDALREDVRKFEAGDEALKSNFLQEMDHLKEAIESLQILKRTKLG